MNIFTAIIRWLVALVVALVVWVIIIVLVPLSVFEEQVLVRENAIKWAAVLTASDEGIYSFRENLIVSFATGDTIEDPAMRAVLLKATDPRSSVGKAVRNVFTPASVRENLSTNVVRFFDWYDGGSVKPIFFFKLAGSKADHAAILDGYVKEKYSQLPKCKNAAEIREQASKDFPECQVVSPDKADYSAISNEMMKDPQYKTLTTKGLDFPVDVEPGTRQSIHTFQASVARQMMFVWIVIIVGGLIMIALFTPRNVSFMATGVVIGSAGLVLLSMGMSLAGLNNGAFMSLASPIMMNGWLVTALGAALVILGIVMPFIEKNKTDGEVAKTGNLTNTPATASTVSVTSTTTTTKTKGATRDEVAKKVGEDRKKL